MTDRKARQERWLEGGLTRRDFLMKTAISGVAVSLMPGMMAGVSRADSMKKGGRFRMGMAGGNTADSLDPGQLNDAMNQNLNWQLRNNLVEVDPSGQVIPELAKSWEPSADAKTWIFQLRKGVAFHNGKPLTAEDVQASMNHHRGEQSKSSGKALLKPVEKVQTDGKHTVVFILNSPNANFPAVLTDFHFSIFPAGTKGSDFEKGIGTGPYMLKSWEPGVRAYAVRNPNYWKKGRGHFDEVETLGIADVTARTNALRTGQIDYMNQCELKTVHLLKRDQALQILKYAGNFHYTLPMWVDRAPFDDLNVRLALKYAIDREEILKQFLLGYGRVGNDHPISPNYQHYAANLKQRSYDPDKAKFYMKKAGMLGESFKLHTSTLGSFKDAAILYKEQAKAAGINIELIQEPQDGYWANVWLKKPWVCCYWNGRATEDLMFSAVYSKASSWNDTHWKNPEFNSLLKSARAELDASKREDMYHEMQRLCRDDGGTIVYAFKDFVEAAANKVGHSDQLSGYLEADGCRNTERWWFKS